MKLSAILEDIYPQNSFENGLMPYHIYDFYALIGSGVPLKPVSYVIDDFGKFLHTSMYKEIIARISSVFSDYGYFPSSQSWEENDGNKKVWHDAYNAFKPYLSKMKDGAFKWNSSEFNYDPIILDVMYKLSEQEIDSFFDSTYSSLFFSAKNENEWKNIWEVYKDVKLDLISSDLCKKIIAIDRILQLIHHAGTPVVGHLSGKKDRGESILVALNNKFKSASIDDFIDKADSKVRTYINKQLRYQPNIKIDNSTDTDNGNTISIIVEYLSKDDKFSSIKTSNNIIHGNSNHTYHEKFDDEYIKKHILIPFTIKVDYPTIKPSKVRYTMFGEKMEHNEISININEDKWWIQSLSTFLHMK